MQQASPVLLLLSASRHVLFPERPLGYPSKVTTKIRQIHLQGHLARKAAEAGAETVRTRHHVIDLNGDAGLWTQLDAVLQWVWSVGFRAAHRHVAYGQLKGFGY